MSQIYQNIANAKLLFLFGVVLLHCNIVQGAGCDCLGSEIVHFLSQRLTVVCVPGFFFISGWLFFKGELNSLVPKLKRRVNTLLVPYLLWNVIGLLAVLSKVLLFPDFFPSYRDIDLSFLGVLKGFFALDMIGVSDAPYPYDFVLWFVRNLIVATALGGLLWRLAGVRRSGLLIVAGLIVAGYFYNPYNLVSSFAFFYAGGILGNRFESFAGVMLGKGCRWLPGGAFSVYLVYAATGDVADLPQWADYALGFPMILSGIIGVIGLSGTRSATCLNDRFGKCSFFIYACHGLYVTVILRIMQSFFSPVSTVTYLACFVACFASLFGISYAVYLAGMKLFPSFTSALCGNRNK